MPLQQGWNPFTFSPVQPHTGGWSMWGSSGAPTLTFDSVSTGSIPLGDFALPLEDHLITATRDMILKGEYVDAFSLLFYNLEKEDKEDLDEHQKECIKLCTIDQIYANRYPGFFIYAGVIVRH